jgi:hypothetical protein
MHEVIAQNMRIGETLPELWRELSSLYAEVSGYMGEISAELDSFFLMMDPYVSYFFPETESSGFVEDMVIPSKAELDGSIASAVKIMEDDTGIHHGISEAVLSSLKLQESVDAIGAYIESTEIYSVNTMIISFQSGRGGDSLATISGKMGDLSRQGSAIATLFTRQMTELRTLHDDFVRIRDHIEFMHETFLTSIKIRSEMNFSRLLKQLDNMSHEVNDRYGVLRRVRARTDAILTNHQFEDLIRQDIQKLTGVDELLATDCEDERRRMLMKAAAWKLTGLEGAVSEFTGELGRNMDDVRLSLQQFISSLNVDAQQSNSGGLLNAIIAETEAMKTEYTSYISELVEDKERLFACLGSIDANITEFGNHYRKLGAIAKNFEIIILLTKIELARHPELQRSLGGALSDVSTLPARIKALIAPVTPLYTRLARDISQAMEDYQARFQEQRRILERCGDSMKKVAVHIHESEKYHGDFVSQSQSYATSLGSFVADEEDKLAGVKGHFSTLADMVRKQRAVSGFTGTYDEADFSGFRTEITMMIDERQASAANGDYQAMILVSLMNELLETPRAGKGGDIEFF